MIGRARASPTTESTTARASRKYRDVEIFRLIFSVCPAPANCAATTLAPVGKPIMMPTSIMEIVLVEPTAARALALTYLPTTMLSTML